MSPLIFLERRKTRSRGLLDLWMKNIAGMYSLGRKGSSAKGVVEYEGENHQGFVRQMA